MIYILKTLKTLKTLKYIIKFKMKTFIIVLGNSKPECYKKRVDRCMETFLKLRKEKEIYIIMSGGKNESKNMKEYVLLKYGHEYDPFIIEEKKSLNTHQNLLFSKEIIESICPTFFSIIICTSTFHINRSFLLSNIVFGNECNIHTIHTRTPVSNELYEREKILIDHLIKQFIVEI